MKIHFIILSTGAYSDYEPKYYMGYTQITQKELDEKSVEIGNAMYEKWLALPERKSTSNFEWEKDKMERYDPETNETVYSPFENDYILILEKWLLEEMGYEKLPDDIPEINTYDKIPNSLDIEEK